MRDFKIDISAGGVLLLAALYFFMDGAAAALGYAVSRLTSAAQ